MSTLLVDQLKTELTHEIRLTSLSRVHISALYPYLFLYNSPVGTFTLSILKDAVTIFSQSFDSAAIKISMATTDDYAHVFYPVIPPNPLPIEAGLYTIKLSATGYNPSESSYLGWIKQHENVQNNLEYTPVNDTYNPYAIRIKVFK